MDHSSVLNLFSLLSIKIWYSASYGSLAYKYILSVSGCLSDCNWNRTHNLSVRKRTLNHLAKLAKSLSCVVSSYLYGTSDCMFLSCHVRISEWRVPWHLGKHRVWIHSEMRTWHDKNLQSECLLIKFNNAFVFPDPEPLIICILYEWSGIYGQFELCFVLCSFA